MKKLFSLRMNNRAQTAMEYLLILAVVGLIVLSSFKLLLPDSPLTPNPHNVQRGVEGYYNSVTKAILNPENVRPIDGGWCPVECPTEPGRGNTRMYRTCECPPPAFGGRHCTEILGSEIVMCSGQTALPLCTGGAISTPAAPCFCVPTAGSCDALPPPCGEITHGVNSCQQACFKQGVACLH